MVFRDCQIRTIATSCSANSTTFSMHALQQLAGSCKAVTRQARPLALTGTNLFAAVPDAMREVHKAIARFEGRKTLQH